VRTFVCLDPALEVLQSGVRGHHLVIVVLELQRVVLLQDFGVVADGLDEQQKRVLAPGLDGERLAPLDGGVGGIKNRDTPLGDGRAHVVEPHVHRFLHRHGHLVADPLTVTVAGGKEGRIGRLQPDFPTVRSHVEQLHLVPHPQQKPRQLRADVGFAPRRQAHLVG